VGNLLQAQLTAARLGMSWLEMTAGAAAVVAQRTMMMGAAMTRPGGLADPEFALMVTEKMAAVGEAAERASRHALRRAGTSRRRSPAADLAATVGAAESCLVPFQRRVRANVKRLARQRG
jgi:hypothetical protein